MDNKEVSSKKAFKTLIDEFKIEGIDYNVSWDYNRMKILITKDYKHTQLMLGILLPYMDKETLRDFMDFCNYWGDAQLWECLRSYHDHTPNYHASRGRNHHYFVMKYNLQ